MTAAAARFDDRGLESFLGVASRGELRRLAINSDDVAGQVAARRWQVSGLAVILHNGLPTTDQRRRVALINCGPRAVLTSFTAAEQRGLRGWERPEVHVLAPAGTRRPPIRGLVLHRTGNWAAVEASAAGRRQALPQALVIAASSVPSSRPGCGLLAAAVQQRLTSAAALASATTAATRTRHRAALLRAIEDIAQGAQALSEIDFVQLCRRYQLPVPTLQAVRVEPTGRRRYLDAEWRRSDGRVIAVEVDGALHLSAQRWYDDQLRQNEAVLGGTMVLRFPSVVVRDSPALVAAQLRRILLPARS
ncbi:MAG: hypothetical protein QOH89_360 [Pseudonocardiales bacterium]|nr:hypothetical protein [Pseudonocardiales bacterium]